MKGWLPLSIHCDGLLCPRPQHWAMHGLIREVMPYAPHSRPSAGLPSRWCKSSPTRPAGCSPPAPTSCPTTISLALFWPRWPPSWSLSVLPDGALRQCFLICGSSPWSGGPAVIAFRFSCPLIRADFSNHPPLKQHLITLHPSHPVYSSLLVPLLSHYTLTCLFLPPAPHKPHEKREVSVLAAESPASSCATTRQVLQL